MNKLDIIENIFIPLVSAILGVVLALWYQYKTDKKKDKKQILAVLLAHRGVYAREPDFVKAVNLIDIYFYDNKEVRRLGHSYISKLAPPDFESGEHLKILLDLILEMAKDIGYADLKQSDIINYYYPQFYEPILKEGEENGS
jgi:hypothetical protein